MLTATLKLESGTSADLKWYPKIGCFPETSALFIGNLPETGTRGFSPHCHRWFRESGRHMPRVESIISPVVLDSRNKLVLQWLYVHVEI